MPNAHPALSRKFIEQQRRRLEGLRGQLLGGERRTLDRERAFRETHGGEAQEFEDASQDMSRREIEQALHDVDERRLQAIERALEKIAEGSYGLSDRSGQPIPRARLESTPEAVLTVEEEDLRESRHPM